jgi:hypothetical protein
MIDRLREKHYSELKKTNNALTAKIKKYHLKLDFIHKKTLFFTNSKVYKIWQILYLIIHNICNTYDKYTGKQNRSN